MKKKINLSSVWTRYQDNQENNNHSENVVLLAKYFGTDEDIVEAERIRDEHHSVGYLTSDLGYRRDKIHNKLYPILVRLVQ